MKNEEPAVQLQHVMAGNRYGRKGQRCEILGLEAQKGTNLPANQNVQVRFEDGSTMIVNRGALRRAKGA